MKIEDLFVSSLGSASKLQWYLQHDISLIVYLNARWPQVMFLATTITTLIPKSKLKAEFSEINSQKILKILKQERPDLYKILNTEKGLVWLDREIQGFKDYFLK